MQVFEIECGHCGASYEASTPEDALAQMTDHQDPSNRDPDVYEGDTEDTEHWVKHFGYRNSKRKWVEIDEHDFTPKYGEAETGKMFVLTITMTSTERVEVPVRATDKDAAVQKGYTYDLSGEKVEVVESEIHVEAKPLPADHEAHPIQWGGEGTRCKWCDKPVHWTGKRTPTGTIPGPWVHTE